MGEESILKNKKKIAIYVVSFMLIGVLSLLFASAATNQNLSNLPAVRTLGIYPGFGNESGLKRHEAIENFLGRKILFADANLDHRNWSAFGGSSWGNFENSTSLFRNRTDVVTAVTIPLRVSEVGAETNKAGGPEKIRKELEDTANGVNDARYKIVAERLVKYGQKKAILRLGHEADIQYYPWAFRNGNEDVYIKAFRHVVNLFRATPGNEFRIDYQGNGAFNASYTSPRTGKTTTYAEAAYPGNDYVDIIGIDVYNRTTWSSVENKLNYTLAMAKKYGKPMSIPEWGNWASDPDTGDDPQFIQNMYDWINKTPNSGPGSMVYHSYFYAHKEANLDIMPKSKAKFKELFGSGNTTQVSSPALPSEQPSSEPEQPQTEEQQPVKPISELPDVIIESSSVATIPSAPKAGEEVQFSVTIKNIGKSPTPEGVIHGVGFFIDGRNVAWSDSSTASLAPGATRTLITNGGPDGNESWTATVGDITVQARWDDIGRIAESNEDNNRLDLTFNVSQSESPVTIEPEEQTQAQQPEDTVSPTTAPDVVIVPNSLVVSPANPRAGDEVQFSVTITNIGDAPTPNNIVHGVAFIIDGNNVAWSGNSTASLAPGASRTLTTNNGPDGNESWNATEGIISVRAIWDDVGRITESNESNNALNGVFTVKPTAIEEIDTIAPLVRITSPTNNQKVLGTVSVTITATDNKTINRVELYLDSSNKVAAIDTRSPYRFSLDTTNLSDGEHVLRVVAYDSSGNISQPTTIKIIVDNVSDAAASQDDTTQGNLEGDLNNDNQVNVKDLLIVIQNFKKNNASKDQGDLDGNGVVNVYDLVLLLTQWGRR